MLRKSLIAGAGLLGLIAATSVAGATPASAGYACGPWNGWCAFFVPSYGWYGWNKPHYNHHWKGQRSNNWNYGWNGNKGWNGKRGWNGQAYQYRNYKHYR